MYLRPAVAVAALLMEVGEEARGQRAGAAELRLVAPVAVLEAGQAAVLAEGQEEEVVPRTSLMGRMALTPCKGCSEV